MQAKQWIAGVLDSWQEDPYLESSMHRPTIRELDESIENLFLSVLQYDCPPTPPLTTDVLCYNTGLGNATCTTAYLLWNLQEEAMSRWLMCPTTWITSCYPTASPASVKSGRHLKIYCLVFCIFFMLFQNTTVLEYLTKKHSEHNMKEIIYSSGFEKKPFTRIL